VDMLNRDVIRAGRNASFTIIFGNLGNVDAHGVILEIGGIPNDVAIQRNFEISYPPQPDQGDSVDWASLPIFFEDTIEVSLDGSDQGFLVVKDAPLYFYDIPVDKMYSLEFQLNDPTNGTMSPYVKMYGPTGYEYDEMVDLAMFICFTEIIKQGLLTFSGIDQECIDALIDSYAGFAQFVIDNWGTGFDIYSFMQLSASNVISISPCIESVPGPNKVLKVMKAVHKGYRHWSSIQSIREVCSEAFSFPQKIEKMVQTGSSYDPNDKIGPTGYGDSKFVSEAIDFSYIVFFENIDSALFAADSIWIEDTLSEHLDWSTFEFGEIFAGAGPDSIRPNFNPVVDFDPVNGVITWGLFDINLPPDTFPYWGEGWVSYSVRPLPDLPTGTRIQNIAAIKIRRE